MIISDIYASYSFSVRGCLRGFVSLCGDSVICDLTQLSLYHKPQHTVILMECEDFPPGYTKLKMMSPPENEIVESSCVTINNETYISSSLYRAQQLCFLQSMGNISRGSFQHGPCSTWNVFGTDIDLVNSFRSNHWPNVVLPWIRRCKLKRWPPVCVLKSIKKEGFYVVPISSLPFDQERNNEWRISFPKAELKLVYSFNHCQFLCYGLLNIFLKEVINKAVSFFILYENYCILGYSKR